jgi:hypothetical protein
MYHIMSNFGKCDAIIKGRQMTVPVDFPTDDQHL